MASQVLSLICAWVRFLGMLHACETKVCVYQHRAIKVRMVKDRTLQIDTLEVGSIQAGIGKVGKTGPRTQDRLPKDWRTEKNAPMQVALAWLLHRAPNILLIPGTSSIVHLRENLAAVELTLTDTIAAELDAIDGRNSRGEP